MPDIFEMQAVDAGERRKDFLTPAEVDRLLKATADSRHSARDRALILTMYRHGLRVSELIGLRISDVDWDQHRIFVRRLKNGLSVSQPIEGDVMRALKRYLATRDDAAPWLFMSERGGPLLRQSVHLLIAKVGERAGLGAVWPHMLRHSCGYALADLGVDLRVLQDFLGHRDPKHTAYYSRTSPARFEKIWRRKGR